MRWPWQINGSSYSLSAHYDTGKSLGLTHQEMQLARNATAADPKAESMLRFTQAVVLQRGEISDDDFQALRKAGFTDAQIVEIVANIALNIFSNYFNSVAKTEVDFPLLQPGVEAPRVGNCSVNDPTRHAEGQVTKTAVKQKVVIRHKLIGSLAPESVATLRTTATKPNVEKERKQK